MLSGHALHPAFCRAYAAAMADDERPTFALGRRPYTVEGHQHPDRVTAPGWRAAQVRVVAAVVIVALLVATAVYAVATA